MRLLLAVLVGAVLIFVGHSFTAEQIFWHLPMYLVERYEAYAVENNVEGPPSYLVPEIGVSMALQVSGIFWCLWGGLAAGLVRPRAALQASVILAGLLLPFWIVKALLQGPWGLPSYAAGATLILAGAWLGRWLRRGALRSATDMSVW